jgi:4,5-DOPA dioxygenase extradiol
MHATATNPSPMPALFLGHGNPMNALANNAWTGAWHGIAAALPRPRAVLCVSAHWYGPGTAVTAMARPRTIHDFGGFPQELFAFRYEPDGDPALAHAIRALLQPTEVALDHDWGLDHGTWSVLCHMYPRADIPVLQLSIDATLPASAHYALGRQLRALREQGVLIVGSGNIVHNLHAYAWGRHPAQPYDWALEFEQRMRTAILAGDHSPIIDYETIGRAAQLSVPTPEHFLPLLYVLGASHPGEPVVFPVDGIDGGSIAMLGVLLGQGAPIPPAPDAD